MIQYDRIKFIAGYTQAFKAPSQSQTTGVNAFLDAVEKDSEMTDIRWVSYALATTYHECAGTWHAIEEFGKGAGHGYGKPVTVVDSEGKSYSNVYYGRGYVQLTFDYNYRNMGRILNNRLLYEPELALQPDIAYAILSYGMRHGSFTGAGLSKFINANGCDYVNARRIINGIDKAEDIAKYAVKFEKILRDSATVSLPPPVPPELTEAEKAEVQAEVSASLSASVDPTPTRDE